MVQGYPVQKAAAKKTKRGGLKTSNYFGDHPLESPQDEGAGRRGHVDVDEDGNVIYERDVGEEKRRPKFRSPG